MQKFANNWKTELVSPLALAAQALDIPPQMVAALGLGPDDFADLTINPDGPTEIIRVVASGEGALSIDQRGLEGTSTGQWPEGTVVACCVTAAMLERLQGQGGGGGNAGTVLLVDEVGGSFVAGPDIGYMRLHLYEDPVEIHLPIPPLGRCITFDVHIQASEESAGREMVTFPGYIISQTGADIVSHFSWGLGDPLSVFVPNAELLVGRMVLDNDADWGLGGTFIVGHEAWPYEL